MLPKDAKQPLAPAGASRRALGEINITKEQMRGLATKRTQHEALIEQVSARMCPCACGKGVRRQSQGAIG